MLVSRALRHGMLHPPRRGQNGLQAQERSFHKTIAERSRDPCECQGDDRNKRVEMMWLPKLHVVIADSGGKAVEEVEAVADASGGSERTRPQDGLQTAQGINAEQQYRACGDCDERVSKCKHEGTKKGSIARAGAEIIADDEDRWRNDCRCPCASAPPKSNVSMRKNNEPYTAPPATPLPTKWLKRRRRNGIAATTTRQRVNSRPRLRTIQTTAGQMQ
jgi:hypothetical protein